MMLERLWRSCRLPVWADEEQNRIARTLFIIQVVLLFGALVVIGVAWATDQPTVVVGLVAGVAAIVVSVLVSWRGHLPAGSFLVLLTLLLLVNYLLWTGLGIHDTAMMLFPVIIIIASLLVGPRAFGVLVVLMLVSLGALAISGIDDDPPLTVSWSDLVVVEVIFIIAALTVRFLADGLRHSLTRARHNEQALADSNLQLQRDAARLEILVEIDRAILNAQTLDSIALAVLERMRSLVPSRYAALVLFDFSRHRHEAFVMKTDHGVEIFREWRPLEHFEIMEPLRQGQSHVVSDILALSARTPMEDQLLSEGTRSYIDAPLSVQGELIGALSFEAVEVAAYDAERVKMIQQVADHLAIAVSSARLFEAEQYRVGLLTTLHDTTLDLSAQLDWKSLLQTIVERAAQLIQAQMGALYLLQPDGRTLQEVCRYQLPESDTFDQMQLGEGLSGHVALTGESLALDDYAQWPQRDPRAAGLPYRSTLAAPIKWQGKVLGTITLLDARPALFGPDDARALDFLAAQAAVAIHNARSFESEQQRVALLKALHEIGFDLSVQRELPALLEQLVERVTQLLNAPMGYLYLMRPDNATLQLNVSHNLPPQFTARQIRVGEGLAGYVAQTGEAYFVEDYRTWPGRYAWVGDPYRSGLAVPIRWQKRVLGVLGVLYDQPVSRAAVDVEAMQLLGAQVAVAIENARLFEATHQQLDNLRVLQAVSVVAADAADEFDLISRVTEIIGLTTTPYSFGVLLVDEAAQVLRVHDSYRRREGDVSSESLPLDSGVVGWVVQHGKPRYIVDVDQAPEYVPGNPFTRSELAVPLKVGSRVIGVLNAESSQCDAFTNDDERLLVTIAGQLATAIARLRSSAEQEALILDLEAKNAELERFTYTVSHDLKSPLITIRGFLGFVEQDAVAGNLDRLHLDMERISSATDKMHRLLNDLLELSRIGRLMSPAQAVSFEVIVREAIELVRGRIAARGVQIIIEPDLPVVYGDRTRLVEVVQNLVDNAAKFIGQQEEPRIDIGQRGHDPDGHPLFFVRDNGLGIDVAYHSKVFGLFDKLDVHSEGTGVGLTLVKRIVEVHGGTIWVESAGLNQGSTFYFSLPTPT
jgi:GAF domain-containing protein/two-component sensor histidine kinase